MNIPYPIVFGRKPPNLRHRVYNKKTYVYSISNYNLHITEESLSGDNTYTISALYQTDFNYFLYGGPGFLKSPLVLPECSGPCSMLLKDWSEGEVVGEDGDRTKMVRAKLQSSSDLWACPTLAALLDCTETDAERRFAETYYKWAIVGDYYDPKAHSHVLHVGPRRFSNFVQEFQNKQLGFSHWNRSASTISASIKESLNAPALIPQVWLNWAYDSSKSPEETNVELEYMPQRVDFVFIYKGTLHVVEIDDPSHYARFDERNHRYEVDEERYTRNLRAERSFREEGFNIHRLSNWEVLNSTESELISLFRYALGIPLIVNEAEPSLPNSDKLPF